MRETIATLRRHFFNGVLWPDFSRIRGPAGFTIEYRELVPEIPEVLAGKAVRAVPVHHTIDAAGFVIAEPGGSIGYSGDTGPTERLWELLNVEADLRALLMEVSFPSRLQALATASGHHTPVTLARDLTKLGVGRDLPILLFHIKPIFQTEVEAECAQLPELNLDVLQLDDQLVL
jgi:3',5'-cyclic-nucleotide phosphodiesterase